MKLLLQQFTLFSLVGIAGTAAHFAVLIVLVQTGLNKPVVASVYGFSAGAVINYLLNRHITFNYSGRHLPTFLKFLTIAVSGLCLNTLLMIGLTRQWHYLASQATAAGLVLVWNFSCNRIWTFRESDLAR